MADDVEKENIICKNFLQLYSIFLKNGYTGIIWKINTVWKYYDRDFKLVLSEIS